MVRNPKDRLVSYRFDEQTIKTIEEKAQRFGCTRSEFLRRLVRATENEMVLLAAMGAAGCRERSGVQQ